MMLPVQLNALMQLQTAGMPLSQASSVNALARLFTNAAKQMIREDVLFDRADHNPKHCRCCVGCAHFHG